MGIVIKKQKLKEVRSKLEINQDELASILNVSNSTIERWEREGVKAGNSTSLKNLQYLMRVYENEKICTHFKALLVEEQSKLLAKSFLFGIGPIINLLPFESGGKHLFKKIFEHYRKILSE